MQLIIAAVGHKMPAWIDTVAATLGKGALLLIDYGLPRSQYWDVPVTEQTEQTSAKRVMDVPLKNDFDKKALISVLYTGAICTIEVVPNDKDAKPLELVLIKRVGANGLKVAVSGYFLCRPADVKDIMDRMSKFN